MTELVPYILSALGVILFWGAKLIVGSITKLSEELAAMRQELASHQVISLTRLDALERHVNDLYTENSALDSRLRAVERITDKLNPN